MDVARRRRPLPPHLRAAPGGSRRHPRPRRHRGPPGRAGAGHPPHALPDRAAEDLRGRDRPRHGHLDARCIGGGGRGVGHVRRDPRRGPARPPPRSRGPSSRSRPWCPPSRSAGAGSTSWPGRGSRSSARPARSRCTASTSSPTPSAPGVYRAEVECSSGTYIRVLADDIGTALGGGAHIGLLRRTRIGSFGEGEMRPLDHLTHDAILTPAQAMRDLALVTVEPEIAGLIGRGLALDRVPIGAVGDGPWAMVDQHGQPAGRLRGHGNRPHQTGRRSGRQLTSNPQARCPELPSPSAPTTACTWGIGPCCATCPPGPRRPGSRPSW